MLCDFMKGYHGVLCAACKEGFFFSDKECLRCDDTAVPPSVVAGLALLVIGAFGLVAYKLFARRHAKTILGNLHGIRRRLRQQRRRRRRQCNPTRRSRSDLVKVIAIRAVHASVRAARDRIGVGGEDFRILLNAAKVVSNLYSTLNYCLAWPARRDSTEHFFRSSALQLHTATARSSHSC